MLALWQDVAAPLPLPATVPEAVGDWLALSAVKETLGDTELEMLVLGDFEELGGALMDIGAEKHVEMEGVGEERVDTEAQALAVAQKLGEAVWVVVEVWEGVPVGVPVPVLDPVALGVGVALAVVEPVRDTVGELEDVMEAEVFKDRGGVGVEVSEDDRVFVVEGVKLGVGVPERVGVGVEEEEGVIEGVLVGEKESVEEKEGGAPAVRDGVGLRD